MNNKLKYLGYSIVFQEVPDEVSLAINISGCPYKCEGCHSKYLWEYNGNYISEDIDNLIKKYSGLITCVCFMGGDQNIIELNQLIHKIQDKGYKCCLYTGKDKIPVNLTKSIDYIKIGRYISELGGLDSTKTNQKMYKRNSDTFVDITDTFFKRSNNNVKNNQEP